MINVVTIDSADRSVALLPGKPENVPSKIANATLSIAASKGSVVVVHLYGPTNVGRLADPGKGVHVFAWPKNLLPGNYKLKIEQIGGEQPQVISLAVTVTDAVPKPALAAVVARAPEIRVYPGWVMVTAKPALASMTNEDRHLAQVEFGINGKRCWGGVRAMELTATGILTQFVNGFGGEAIQINAQKLPADKVVVQTESELREAVTRNNVKVVIPGVVTVSKTIKITGNNVWIMGINERSGILWTGAHNGSERMLQPWGTGCLIEGLRFDIAGAGNSKQEANAIAPSVTCRGLWVRRCVIANVGTFLQLEDRPTDVFVSECANESAGSIRSYFVLVEGTNIVIEDNRITDVVHEHVIRMFDYDGVGIYENWLDNPINIVTDASGKTIRVVKNCITIQRGRGVWVAENTVMGQIEIKPLGGGDGIKQTGYLNHRTQFVQVKANDFDFGSNEQAIIGDRVMGVLWGGDNTIKTVDTQGIKVVGQDGYTLADGKKAYEPDTIEHVTIYDKNIVPGGGRPTVALVNVTDGKGVKILK